MDDTPPHPCLGKNPQCSMQLIEFFHMLRCVMCRGGWEDLWRHLAWMEHWFFMSTSYFSLHINENQSSAPICFDRQVGYTSMTGLIPFIDRLLCFSCKDIQSKSDFPEKFWRLGKFLTVVPSRHCLVPKLFRYKAMTWLAGSLSGLWVGGGAGSCRD